MRPQEAETGPQGSGADKLGALLFHSPVAVSFPFARVVL
jgi:hypothetical protein